jgi:hypothetical protein
LITISTLDESFDLFKFIINNNVSASKHYQDFKIKFKNYSEVLNLSLQCNWIKIEGDIYKLQERGIVLNELYNRKKINHARRAQLYDLVKILRPEWAAYLNRGRTESVTYVASNIKDILKQLKLYNENDSDYDDGAIIWWDKIAGSFYSSINEKKTETGRIGEKITVHYEQKRTNNKPKWMSLKSDSLGYDILSVISKQDTSNYCIEVKTSRYGNIFKFSINEHKLMCQKNLKNYGLYFWRLYSVDKAELTVLKKDDIINQFPKNSKTAKWEICEFNIDNFPNKKNIKTIVIKPPDIGLKQFALME